MFFISLMFPSIFFFSKTRHAINLYAKNHQFKVLLQVTTHEASMEPAIRFSPTPHEEKKGTVAREQCHSSLQEVLPTHLHGTKELLTLFNHDYTP
jgi:hypothetical protein